MLTRFSKVGAVVICLLLVAVDVGRRGGHLTPAVRMPHETEMGVGKRLLFLLLPKAAAVTCSLPLTSIVFYQWNLFGDSADGVNQSPASRMTHTC